MHEELYDISNIIKAFDEVCRTTKNKEKVYKFKMNRCYYINKAYNEMKHVTYKHDSYTEFYIREPKLRLIKSERMYDKMINHLVSREILIPYLCSELEFSNVASQEGKGTSFGEKLYFRYRNIMDSKYNEYYILKCDIKKYFENIDQDILFNLVKKKIKDEYVLKIIKEIINSVPTSLCIGNMTSQIFAIYYLDGVDKFIKYELGVKYYIRYQDDMVLFSCDKEFLKKCKGLISKKLKEVGLELNNKTMIYKNSDNINFLGRRKNGKYTNINRTKRKVRKSIKEYYEGTCSLESIISSVINYESRSGKKIL